MKIDLKISNGLVVRPFQDPVVGDLAINDGKVVAVFPSGDGPEATENIDATDKVVLPGVIDPHLHIGFGNGDADWETESRSATIGGVTTIFSFLMAGTSYVPIIGHTIKVAEETSYVDFGLHVVPCAPIHLDEMAEYARLGVTSFKYFTSFRGTEGAYLGIEGTDDSYLYAYLEKVASIPGAIACVHPENIEVVWFLRDRLQAQGRDDLAAWDEARPPIVEAEAAHRAIAFAHVLSCPTYLVHMSCGLVLDEVRSWRHDHEDAIVFVETCPHFLTHSKDMDLGSLGKINPPLRARSDVEAVWAAVIDGTVDTIGSDHVPRRKEKKAGSIWTSSAGFPGTAAILPVMLDQGVHHRGLSLSRVAELTAANPARAMGCYPQKGSLAPGSDGDVTIVDLNMKKKVTPDTFQSYADYSLYDGMTMTGWPVMTILRGDIVMRDGDAIDRPRKGHYVDRNVYFGSDT